MKSKVKILIVEDDAPPIPVFAHTEIVKTHNDPADLLDVSLPTTIKFIAPPIVQVVQVQQSGKAARRARRKNQRKNIITNSL